MMMDVFSIYFALSPFGKSLGILVLCQNLLFSFVIDFVVPMEAIFCSVSHFLVSKTHPARFHKNASATSQIGPMHSVAQCNIHLVFQIHARLLYRLKTRL